MTNVVQFTTKSEYCAEGFDVSTVYGQFSTSGTLCGNLDFALPQGKGTFCFTPDEAQAIIVALTAARHDVLENSRPSSDPRLYEVRPLLTDPTPATKLSGE